MPESYVPANKHLYLQSNSGFLASVPHTAGVATLAGADACNYVSLDLADGRALIQSQSKASGRSPQGGVPGRHNASFSLVMELAANGSSPVTAAPDCFPLIEAAFGKSHAITAGTCVFDIDDPIRSFTAWEFQSGLGVGETIVAHRVAYGCLPSSLSVGFTEGIARLTANGTCSFIADADLWSQYSTADKGGLTAFPAEPATPVTAGQGMIGFYGSITLDGVSADVEIIGATNTFDTGLSHRQNQFNTKVAGSPKAVRRNPRISFQIVAKSGALQRDIRVKAMQQVGIPFEMVLGENAGNRLKITAPNLLLPFPKRTENDDQEVLSFDDCICRPTTNTAKDELRWTFF